MSFDSATGIFYYRWEDSDSTVIPPGEVYTIEINAYAGFPPVGAPDNLIYTIETVCTVPPNEFIWNVPETVKFDIAVRNTYDSDWTFTPFTVNAFTEATEPFSLTSSTGCSIDVGVYELR